MAISVPAVGKPTFATVFRNCYSPAHASWSRNIFAVFRSAVSGGQRTSPQRQAWLVPPPQSICKGTMLSAKAPLTRRPRRSARPECQASWPCRAALDAPLFGISPDRVVAALIAQPAQLLEHSDQRQPLTRRLALVRQKTGPVGSIFFHADYTWSPRTRRNGARRGCDLGAALLAAQAGGAKPRPLATQSAALTVVSLRAR